MAFALSPPVPLRLQIPFRFLAGVSLFASELNLAPIVSVGKRVVKDFFKRLVFKGFFDVFFRLLSERRQPCERFNVVADGRKVCFSVQKSGQILRVLRELAGVSQREVDKFAGLKGNHTSMLESRSKRQNGSIRFTGDTDLRLAQFFGVSPNAIAEGIQEWPLKRPLRNHVLDKIAAFCEESEGV